MKRRIFKKYRMGKRGGQRYWVGRQLRKNYGMGLPIRMDTIQREQYIKNLITQSKMIPDDTKTEEESIRLTNLTEGLGKGEVKDVFKTFEDRYKPAEKHAKTLKMRLGLQGPVTEKDVRAYETTERLWKAIGGPGEEETLARDLKWTRDYSDKMEKALLAFTPDSKTQDVWRAMVKDPEKIQVWGGESHPENPKKIIKVELTNDYPSINKQIFKIEDEDGSSGYIDYDTKRKKAEFNSP